MAPLRRHSNLVRIGRTCYNRSRPHRILRQYTDIVQAVLAAVPVAVTQAALNRNKGLSLAGLRPVSSLLFLEVLNLKNYFC